MSEKVTWLTPFFDAWKKEYGGTLPAGQAARALAPLCKEIGADETLVRFEWYCRTTPGQYASVTKFAAVHGQYAANAQPKPELSEGGRRPLTMGRVV